MNGFNINRFGKTLRWVMAVNFRKMLLWFTGSVLAVFIGEILFNMMRSYDSPWNMIHDVSQFLTMILVLVSLIMFSSIVSCINEKRKREAFLMLPASNLEKFFSLLVYSTVICVAVAFLAIVLGDALRMLGYWAVGYQGADGTYYWWSSTIPQLMKNILSSFIHIDHPTFKASLNYKVMHTAVACGLWLWIHSLYTLGGTLLRKYAFVATSVVVVLIGMLFGWTVNHFEIQLFTSVWEDGVYTSQFGVGAYIIAIMLPIAAFNCYRASYRIFKGFQLITNKWLNYDFHK